MNRIKTLPRRAWLTWILLAETAVIFSLISLALDSWNGVGWNATPALFLLNTLPVFLTLAVLWLATGQAWLACLITGTLHFLLTGANYFKLLFRDDPMVWGDLHRLREGIEMSAQYDVRFTPLMWGWIAFIAGMSLILLLLGRGRPGPLGRLLGLTACGLALVICFYDVCPDNDRYSALVADHAGNRTEAYAACGVVYPFLHSAGDYMGLTRRFDAQAGKEVMDRYEDADIPADRRVNLIGIQLEAYADFSVFDVDGLSEDVYRPFHQLLEESYHGDLITDIFAGGTTETEWAVLTGGNIHGDFKVKTDSVAWYMKDQGYTVNGSHPCRDWFYDRKHVNPNLGLEDYLFTDNYYYQFIAPGVDVAYDDVFFPDLMERLDAYFRENDAPLFSFNVTYQGHGPYNMEKVYWGDQYCTGDYPRRVRNALNNYFHVIQNTNENLARFTEYLDGLEEPVVLFLYGDHKPWMGNAGAFYANLGISLDTSTEEGFRNYYTTFYLVWANQAAKTAVNWDLTGQGPDLSPCFLMDHVFRLCGWEGSAYMQAQRETAVGVPVLHTTGWVEETDGVLSTEISPAGQSLIERFQNVSLYDRHRFDPGRGGGS